MALMAGCVGAACGAADEALPEKRHSAAELLAYRPMDFAAPMSSRAGEAALLADELARLRERLALPPGPEADAQLPALLAAIALFNVELDAGRARVLAALPTLDARPVDDQRAILSAAHTFAAREAAPLLWPLLPRLSTPREFAIASYTILQATPDAATRSALRRQLQTSFADYPSEPRLRALDARLAERDGTAVRPPLVDLLAAPIRPGRPVIFSLQRQSREHMGLAIVRGADGRFERNADGSLFAIPHLALARSNLPGTITLGNTPQGLFTIIGAGTADNRWIGPTPYLHSMLPIEASASEFEHANALGDWSEARYESFLPPSWRGWGPIKEAWLAGQAGRNEILLHGTTINPAYYRGASYFPGTPSAGCMVAGERWSADSGVLEQSDQLSLAQVFARSGAASGYLVVVEIDDREQPVLLDELNNDIRAAEARTRRPA
jgi:hypothetical protein